MPRRPPLRRSPPLSARPPQVLRREQPQRSDNAALRTSSRLGADGWMRFSAARRSTRSLIVSAAPNATWPTTLPVAFLAPGLVRILRGHHGARGVGAVRVSLHVAPDRLGLARFVEVAQVAEP